MLGLRFVAKRASVIRQGACIHHVDRALPYTTRRFMAAKVKNTKTVSKSFKIKRKGPQSKPAFDAPSVKRVEISVEAPTIALREFQPEFLNLQETNEVMRIPQNITALLNPPHGYPKDLGKDFNTTYNDALMVRESTFKALQLADATQKTTDTSLRVLLTGEAGAGKSATLLQTVSHCLSHKWLVLYVPNAISWVNGSTAYTPMEDTNPVSYKQTSLIQSVLKHFKQMNHSNINELKLSKDYSLGKINLSKQNTLLQLIDEGISNEAMTPVIWTALIDELTSQTSTPVLVAVDQVNVFYTKADYHHSDGSQLMPHELHLIKPLVDLFNGSRILKHGLTIGAMSLRDARMGQSMPVDADNAPTRLLRFPINNFTVTETMSMLDYYYRAQVIFEEPSLSMAIIKHTTTNGNARGLLNSCIHLV